MGRAHNLWQTEELRLVESTHSRTVSSKDTDAQYSVCGHKDSYDYLPSKDTDAREQ